MGDKKWTDGGYKVETQDRHRKIKVVMGKKWQFGD